MTSKVSTESLMLLSPLSAWLDLFFPSNLKGMVTIPTVRIPRSRHACAITGPAPVPVPPPIPAVTKTIFVSAPSKFVRSSRFSIAAFFPTSGIEPAP